MRRTVLIVSIAIILHGISASSYAKELGEVSASLHMDQNERNNIVRLFVATIGTGSAQWNGCTTKKRRDILATRGNESEKQTPYSQVVLKCHALAGDPVFVTKDSTGINSEVYFSSKNDELVDQFEKEAITFGEALVFTSHEKDVTGKNPHITISLGKFSFLFSSPLQNIRFIPKKIHAATREYLDFKTPGERPVNILMFEESDPESDTTTSFLVIQDDLGNARLLQNESEAGNGYGGSVGGDRVHLGSNLDAITGYFGGGGSDQHSETWSLLIWNPEKNRLDFTPIETRDARASLPPIESDQTTKIEWHESVTKTDPQIIQMTRTLESRDWKNQRPVKTLVQAKTCKFETSQHNYVCSEYQPVVSEADAKYFYLD